MLGTLVQFFGCQTALYFFDHFWRLAVCTMKRQRGAVCSFHRPSTPEKPRGGFLRAPPYQPGGWQRDGQRLMQTEKTLPHPMHTLTAALRVLGSAAPSAACPAGCLARARCVFVLGANVAWTHAVCCFAPPLPRGIKRTVGMWRVRCGCPPRQQRGWALAAEAAEGGGGPTGKKAHSAFAPFLWMQAYVTFLASERHVFVVVQLCRRRDTCTGRVSCAVWCFYVCRLCAGGVHINHPLGFSEKILTEPKAPA